MKLIALALMFVSFGAFASPCAQYETSSEKQNVIKAVAKHMNYTVAELCESPKIVDIQITGTHTFTSKGEMIRQFKTAIHYPYYTCYYLMNRETLEYMSGKCFDTW